MHQKLQQDWNDVLPWEQPGAYRLDCEPHRGELLSWLATASVLLSSIGFISLGASAMVGFPLGLVVVFLARRDLTRMKGGQMDPHGDRLTNGAWYEGCVGAGLGLAELVLGLIVLWVWSSWRSGFYAMGLAAI